MVLTPTHYSNKDKQVTTYKKKTTMELTQEKPLFNIMENYSIQVETLRLLAHDWLLAKNLS